MTCRRHRRRRASDLRDLEGGNAPARILYTVCDSFAKTKKRQWLIADRFSVPKSEVTGGEPRSRSLHSIQAPPEILSHFTFVHDVSFDNNVILLLLLLLLASPPNKLTVLYWFSRVACVFRDNPWKHITIEHNIIVEIGRASTDGVWEIAFIRHAEIRRWRYRSRGYFTSIRDYSLEKIRGKPMIFLDIHYDKRFLDVFIKSDFILNRYFFFFFTQISYFRMYQSTNKQLHITFFFQIQHWIT